MPFEFEPLKEGNRDSAEKINEQREIIRAATNISLSGLEGGFTKSGAELAVASKRSGITVTNGTGSTRNRYEVLQIDGSVFNGETEKEQYVPRFRGTGIQCDTDDTEQFAIIQNDNVIEDGQARCYASGETFAKLTGATGKTHASAKSGQYTLETGDSGPVVIIHDPGPTNTERVGYVRFGGGSGDDDISTGPAGTGPCCGTVYASGSVEIDFGGAVGVIEFATNYRSDVGSPFNSVVFTHQGVDGTTGFNYWETDDLNVTCTGGTDIYVGRLYAGGVGPGEFYSEFTLKTGGGYGGAAACCTTNTNGFKWTFRN